MNAHQILEKAAQHMKDRAKRYDNPSGERSMSATVAAFNAVTDSAMTEEQGWLFMVLLKAVRSQQGDYYADSYEDCAAYISLAGECASKQATSDDDGWIEWDGSSKDGPIYPLDAILQVRERSLETMIGPSATSVDWEHHGDESDIIAYKIIG